MRSDGADEIPTVAQAAGRAGIEVLFITDHNTDSHHAHLNDDELIAVTNPIVLEAA